MLETGDFGGDKLGGLEFAGFSRQNTDFGALQTPGAGKRANLEAQAALLTPDTKKNAIFGVRRFQRFLHQKRSGDIDR